MKGFSVTHTLVRISPIKLLSSERLFGFSYTETVRFGERGVIFGNSVPWGCEEACWVQGREGDERWKMDKEGRFLLSCHIAQTPTFGFRPFLAFSCS